MSGPAISTTEPAQSVEQLVGALSRKGIPLPHEIGTFIVLESCERLIGQPLTAITAGDVWLSDEGEVLLAAGKPASSESQAARALVVLLGELLVRSAPGVPKLLLELVERASVDESLRLGVLRDEVEATLVPLNRAATRRVLARLLREARREREPARFATAPHSVPDTAALDDELDALLGAPRRPPVAAVHVAPRSQPDDEAEPGPAFEPAARRAPAARPSPRPIDRELTEASEHGRSAPRLIDDGNEDDLIGDADARSSGAGLRWAAILLVLTALIAGVYVVLGRERVRSLLGPAEAAPLEEVAPAAPKEAPRYGELQVTSTPARAQVLLRVGEAPTVMRGLPIGVAHELVAIAEGRRVARGVVPADAAWSQVDGAPQYELALQLDEGKKGAERELGPTRLPEALGAPTGAVGNVRVITAPPGAVVYQLIGFTPDVRVESLDLATPRELLVYLSGYEPERVELTEASYAQQGERWVAALDVQLRKR